MTKSKNNNRTKKAQIKPKSKIKFLFVFIIFGIIGGIYFLISTRAAGTYVTDPQHRAACIENSPSKTAVRPGEVFTARVRIQNTGSSTFSGAFGLALAEFKNSGPETWNASGKDLSGNVGPGGTATFNLTLRAPNTPGTYAFEWGVLIVFQGFIPTACTGRSIVVTNPPTVSLLANNQGNISLTRGSPLTLNWNATNNPTRCVASGNWGGDKPASGSENRNSDTSSSGTKSYTLSCSNGVGSASDTRQVTVNNPPIIPAPAPPPSGGGGGSTSPSSPSAPPSSGGGSAPSNNNSGTPPISGSTDNPIVQTSSSEPPTTPTNFSSRIANESNVELTWEKPTFNGILQGYELEKSINQTEWQKIGPDVITNETYTDSSVGFETKYYYRIRAIDYENRKSEYALTDITTPPFSANLSTEDITLTSEDGKVSVRIPKNAVSAEAQCSLSVNNNVSAPENNLEQLAGPYEVLCKTKDGQVIKSFNEQLNVTIKPDKQDYKTLAYFVYGDDWQEVEGQYSDGVGFFQIKDQNTFVIFGQAKSMPLILKIFISVLIIALIVFGVLFGIFFFKRYQQKQLAKNQYEDYYRKEHGY